MKIVADKDIPFIRGVLEPFAQVVYAGGAQISKSDLSGADVLLVRTRTRCDSRLLEGSKVRLIATATIGTDHIDLDYCREHDIKVAAAAGCNARGVLQWVSASLADITGYGHIDPRELTLGVVGVGNVGSLVEAYAKSWGFRVLCSDPPRQREGRPGLVPLGHIAGEADIITFHTPLTSVGPDATFHLAGEKFFHRVKPGAVIVNSSRGEVVDTTALLDAVSQKACRAYIDTWEGEPYPDPELLAAARFATPHIAGYTAQGKANASSMIINAVSMEFGLPLQDWYPPEVVRTQPCMIPWPGMVASIPSYCDLLHESAVLRAAPGEFERLRNNYAYRQEYF